MGQHAEYGKRLLADMAGKHFTDDWEVTSVKYRGGTSAHIDGVIGEDCAIEIEARVDKQVRGALVDLLLHHCSKKLLVLIPAWMNQPENSKEQCKGILYTLKRPSDEVQVVLLQGTGDNPMPEKDKALLKAALLELGVILPD